MQDRFSTVFSTILAFVGYVGNILWGGFDSALIALIIFMGMDYITGVLGGWSRGELSSRHAREGIVQKIVTLLLVGVAYRLDVVLNAGGGVKILVVFFFLGHEGISILENAAVLGVPIPEVLKSNLEQLQEGGRKHPKTDSED